MDIIIIVEVAAAATEAIATIEVVVIITTTTIIEEEVLVETINKEIINKGVSSSSSLSMGRLTISGIGYSKSHRMEIRVVSSSSKIGSRGR